MVAKPSKCKSFGLCRNNVSYRAGDPNTKTYAPFDPKLFIAGCLIRFLGNDPFKFLGRIVYTHLKDSAQRKLVLDKLHEDMRIVDAIHLKGIAKAWLYNNYIIAFLSWPLLIYDFPPTFTNAITATVTRYIKKWLNIHKTVSPELLFNPSPGLGLHHPKIYLKSLQVVKYLILAKSKDTRSNYLASRQLTEAKHNKSKRWQPSIVATTIERDLQWEEHFQRDPSILSNTNSNTRSKAFSKCSTKGQRKLITSRLKRNELETMRLRLHGLCRGGDFLNWDNMMEHDLTWNDMIYAIPESVLTFKINATAKALPSISNLRRWGVRRGGRCNLCKKKKKKKKKKKRNCVAQSE
jgi:hypothetical protein